MFTRRFATGAPSRRLSTPLGGAQGAYYLFSGLWPIVSYRTFEWITGRKREPWLVKTVGLVTVAIGSVLVADARGGSPQTRRLGVTSAIAFAAIDTWYAGIRRRIRPVYLLDALAQAALAAAWLSRSERARR